MSTSSFFRNLLASIAIVLGCLLLTLSVAVVWLHEVVIDSNRFVDTVTPLAEDPAVKDAVADYATEDLFLQVNVEALAQDALPSNSDILVGPMVGTLKGYMYGQIREQLDQPEFVTVWQLSNREAHSAMLQMMRGGNGTDPGEEGKVLIDVSRVFDMLKARLSASGFTFLDNVQIEAGHRFTIFQFPTPAKARRGFNLLEGSALWLPISSALLLAAGIWLSTNRRRTLVGMGAGIAGFTALMYFSVAPLREYYLTAVIQRGAIDVPAATSFFDILISPLRSLVKTAFVAGVAIAAVAFVAGLVGHLPRKR